MHPLRRLAAVCALALLTAVTPAEAVQDGLRLADQPLMPKLPTTTTSRLVREALGSSAKYLLNTWWSEQLMWAAPAHSWSETLAATGTFDDEGVRRFSSAALALSAYVVTGAYDVKITGVDAGTARSRAAHLVATNVRTHIANVPNGAAWGGRWQSALWASQTALAGWLLGSSLSEADRVLLARMLVYEADTVAARPIHYMRDRAGKVLTRGDSGAEEVAWDALAEYTAVELLPHHSRRLAWAEDAYRRFVASYSLPDDVHSKKVVNGRPLSAWLGGSNIEPSGWVVNHGRLSPDYTAGFSLHALAVPGLVRARVPEAILHNQALLYANIAGHRFTSPPSRKPGGSVYVPGSPNLYYPHAPDWGTHRHAMYVALDVEVSAVGLDRGLRTSADRWATLHAGQVRLMQQRFTTGQIHGAKSEDTYAPREEHAAAMLAYAHLTGVLAHAGRMRVDTAPPEDTKQPR